MPEHWHRCRNWWKEGLPCPFQADDMHQETDEGDPPDDDEIGRPKPPVPPGQKQDKTKKEDKGEEVREAVKLPVKETIRQIPLDDFPQLPFPNMPELDPGPPPVREGTTPAPPETRVTPLPGNFPLPDPAHPRMFPFQNPDPVRSAYRSIGLNTIPKGVNVEDPSLYNPKTKQRLTVAEGELSRYVSTTIPDSPDSKKGTNRPAVAGDGSGLDPALYFSVAAAGMVLAGAIIAAHAGFKGDGGGPSQPAPKAAAPRPRVSSAKPAGAKAGSAGGGYFKDFAAALEFKIVGGGLD